MDMDGMDMGGMDMGGMGMGGMDMGSEGLFTRTNRQIARGYWYGIAAVVGLLSLVRLTNSLETRMRLRRLRTEPGSIPSRPQNALMQAYATATATVREILYPQPIYFTGYISKYFTPLPAGRWLILTLYWIVILIFLWSNTILAPSNPQYAYRWEKVGFRAAWVSVTQIPFIFLLSTKCNPLSLLTGISYERLNWLHRWIARTVFLTVIVHWSFFLREWWLADFVQLEIKMMPMVKYGFGAFGTIAWMVLSGFGFFRNMNYELFVAQHICAFAVFLWLLHSHLPSYARYNVYLSIGFIAFDWGMRIVWSIMRNSHLSKGRIRFPGYTAHLQELPGNVVRLTISDADFTWRAGQHAYLAIPGLRPFELHPFTIANCYEANSYPWHPLTMLIKAHSGFSKSLHKATMQNVTTNRTYRAFITGPWGMPPVLSQYDTVVLIACSTGATFTTPLLQDLVKKRGCVRSATLHWIIRSADHFVWFGETLKELVRNAQNLGLDVQIIVHITQTDIKEGCDWPNVELKDPVTEQVAALGMMPDGRHRNVNAGCSAPSVIPHEDQKSLLTVNSQSVQAQCKSAVTILCSGRPTIEAMIRQPVETALGETAVVVCGGLAITAQVRNFVAALSDERAVHKGTGTQGIFLFTETYGW